MQIEIKEGFKAVSNGIEFNPGRFQVLAVGEGSAWLQALDQHNGFCRCFVSLSFFNRWN